jgi:hypothetical protein
VWATAGNLVLYRGPNGEPDSRVWATAGNLILHCGPNGESYSGVWATAGIRFCTVCHIWRI